MLPWDIYWNEWLQGNHKKAVELFFNHLNDGDFSNYEGGQAQKDADLADDLEILLDKPEIVYPIIEQELNKIDLSDHRIFTFFSAIRDDLLHKPNNFSFVKNILLTNLKKSGGNKSILLLSAILITIDKFSEKERLDIIRNLVEGIKNDYLHIGKSLIIATHYLLLKDYKKFVLNLKKAYTISMAITTYFDEAYFEAFLYFCLNLFCNFKNTFSDFKDLENLRGKFSDYYIKVSPYKLIDTKTFIKISNNLIYLFDSLNDFIHKPSFVSDIKYGPGYEKNLSELEELYKEQIEMKLFDRRVNATHHNEEVFERTITTYKDSLNFFISYKNLSLKYQDIMKYLPSIEIEQIPQMISEINNLTDNFYFPPARFLAKILKDLLINKINSSIKAREVLGEFIKEKNQIISILGPFNEEEDWKETSENYKKISLWLTSKNENFVPQFIPAQFQGELNPTLFDIFVNMSKFIICYYKPSKSAGHVDEISRLLERRVIPPTILISKCEFPTTTQMTGIKQNIKMKIFCFKDDKIKFKCSYYKKCLFGQDCKREKLPVSNIEAALEKAYKWIIKIEEK